MALREELLTKDFILNFNPDDWNFRRSSGYPGYDHYTKPNNESSWIYEEEFHKAQSIKNDYNRDYKMIMILKENNLLVEEKSSDLHISDFLNKRYFKQ